MGFDFQFRALLVLGISRCIAANIPLIKNIHTPSDCLQISKPGDHLLLSFRVFKDESGEIIRQVEKPFQLWHTVLESSDTLPMHKYLKGMCLNETRLLTFEGIGNLDLAPLPIPKNSLVDVDDKLSVEVTIDSITDPDDYLVFSAFREGNLSLVLDFVDQHKGINSVDEVGQTLLMHAVQKGQIQIVSALLNTRMPKVDVNKAKANGFTAVFYAVDLPQTYILSALLRRGADPNAQLHLSGKNTPLHLAVMFEKTKHAELLIEYGANPSLYNENGQTPLELLPRDAVRSTKLYFRKMFQDAATRLTSAANDVANTAQKKQRTDL